MKLEKNVSLKSLNTFGIDASAASYTALTDLSQLGDLADLAARYRGIHILGGGSNILITKDIEGVVIKNCLKGIDVVKENHNHVWIKAMAGEIWHQFVLETISRNLAGIENLSLIPGCIGASPMQNIGAYGVEVKDVIEEVEAWDIATNKPIHLSAADCRFGYRDSIFKNELKGKTIITSVTYRLNKMAAVNTKYGAIADQLELMGIKDPGIKDVSNAVIAIRQSKLPDPAQIGNAGSFFKNPTISTEDFDRLKEMHIDIPGYRLPGDSVKVPAGWLIEKAGWKGYREGDMG
ncbi:MAG: UDP-N-acetylmuramate dehydrogenase, partial [Chitinophagaceae bacterium]